jgi:hypothetical protein
LNVGNTLESIEHIIRVLALYECPFDILKKSFIGAHIKSKELLLRLLMLEVSLAVQVLCLDVAQTLGERAI